MTHHSVSGTESDSTGNGNGHYQELENGAAQQRPTVWVIFVQGPLFRISTGPNRNGWSHNFC